MEHKKLTPYQQQVYDLNQSGMTQKSISLKLGVTQQSVSSALLSCKRKGYNVLLHYHQKKEVHDPKDNKYYFRV
ncbi:MAG TPA: hypothetical protein DF712_20960 [Balneola sp.]|nr:hypothetical protein [Balneola sp.]|tara:strand:+ start:5393 stop:5614 length:222 start_codon:yes stop_codon:yes gene_type:complete